jgi:hypothetical protein
LWNYAGTSLGMTLDSSGNLGLGVTPSAWATFKAIQIGNGTADTFIAVSGNQGDFGVNAYYNAGWKYQSTGVASSRYEQSSGVHQWFTAPSGTAGNAITFTQAMTLDASGNLLVGTTGAAIGSSPGIKSLPAGDGANLPIFGITTGGSTSATAPLQIYSTGAGAYRFYVSANGQINATSTSITAISDQRLKENVRILDTGLDAIMALQPRRFDWKEGKGQDKKNAAGFIAQEFETVFPECVSTSKAGEDGIEYKNINHETLIPTLVKAIQEQQALIQSLTARITALEGN